MNIAQALSSTPVSTLDLSRYVEISPTTTMAEAVQAMSEDERSCACIVSGHELVGVFTQRDVLHRVIGRPENWSRQVGDLSRGPVRTLDNTETLSAGIEIMDRWWIRNVPVLSEGGEFVGNLSFWTVMNTIANLLASRMEESSAGPAVRDGLDFVDFTGLNINPPVTFPVDESLDVAVHHLRNRGLVQILAVDDREHLVGSLTEFDLVTKVGCGLEDLSSVTVGSVMDPDHRAIGIRSSVSDAVRALTEARVSTIAVLAETGRPAGVVSFWDIIHYLEQSLEALTPA
jgi:CBS domain-containing protein